MALAAASIGVALVLAWVLLTGLFEERLADRVQTELESHLEQLTRVVEPGPDGGIELTADLGEPRFARPLSGLYWQIETEGEVVATSESLWDEELAVPGGSTAAGEIVRHAHVAFLDGEVMAVTRRLVLAGPGGDSEVRLIVAVDRAELDAAKAAFADRVSLLVAVMGAFLLVAAAAQILIGLRPLNDLRTRLNAVRAGEAARLEGRFPTEVQGLVDELNGLLAGREEMVSRARARAGDLAHGLKTPLAVMAAEARRLAEAGDAEAAAEIMAQIERMNRNVERELVRARARGVGGLTAVRTELGPAVDRLARAFIRMTEGHEIRWDWSVAEGAAIALDPADLDEVAGNAMDNARKWAKSRVRVTGAPGVLTIEDDGPGVPEAEMANVVERGRRLDEAAPGSGLGLAIVRDVVELYGGRLELARSRLGGLSIRIVVPDPAGRD